MLYYTRLTGLELYKGYAVRHGGLIHVVDIHSLVYHHTIKYNYYVVLSMTRVNDT